MQRITFFGPLLLLLAIIALLITSCNSPARDNQRPHAPLQSSLQSRLDSMEHQIRHAYTPGFGELMLNIQIHHAKLWFAGTQGKWELADYDQSLIRSAIQKIRTFHPDNPNAAATAMIDIPMDSVGAAITRKDPAAFKRSFVFLTATCNNCHTVTKHPYNQIKIPTTPPFSNQ